MNPWLAIIVGLLCAVPIIILWLALCQMAARADNWMEEMRERKV